jgi:hypothetical protein
VFTEGTLTHFGNHNYAQAFIEETKGKSNSRKSERGAGGRAEQRSNSGQKLFCSDNCESHVTAKASQTARWN